MVSAQVKHWKKPQGLQHGLIGYPRKRSRFFKLVRLAILYLLIGLLFVIFKRNKSLFLKWPAAILGR